MCVYILLYPVMDRSAVVAPDVAVRRERRNDRGRGEVDLAAQRDDDDPHVHRVEGRGLRGRRREAVQVGDHQDVVVVDVAQTAARQRHTGRFAATTVVRTVSVRQGGREREPERERERERESQRERARVVR